MSVSEKKILKFEDAVDIAGFGKYNLALLALCGFIIIGMVFETLGLSFIIPAAQCDLQLSNSEKGWLGALPFAAIILTSHMWGYLADTKGRRPVMMFSMSIGTFFSVFSSICPNLWSFAVMRFITGIFASGSSAVIYAYLGEFNNAPQRDKMVAFGASFLSVGMGLMAALAWGVLRLQFNNEVEALGIHYRPWRLLVLLCSMPYFISSIIMIKAPESLRFLMTKGRSEETLQTLATVYKYNKWTKHNPFEGSTLEVTADTTSDERVTFLSILRSMWNQTVPLFQRPLVFTTCIACFAQFSVFSSSNGFYLWLPEILNKLTVGVGNDTAPMNICGYIKHQPVEPFDHSNETVKISPICVDYVNTSTFENSIYISLLFFATLLTASILVNIVGKKIILIIVPSISGLSAIILYWITNRTASLILFALIQICGGSIGIMNAVLVEIYPTHLRAMAVCLSMMFGRSGSILGANLVGYLMEVNCPSSFFVFGGLLVACAAVSSLIQLPKKT